MILDRSRRKRNGCLNNVSIRPTNVQSAGGAAAAAAILFFTLVLGFVHTHNDTHTICITTCLESYLWWKLCGCHETYSTRSPVDKKKIDINDMSIDTQTTKRKQQKENNQQPTTTTNNKNFMTYS
jgi:hypothetical protein